MNRLQGKTAIVTGGAGALGGAMAERFIQEGANVVIADLDEGRARETAKRLGPKALPLLYDAADDASVAAAVAQTVQHFGGLNIICNNAAITGPIIAQDTNPVDIPLALWDQTMAVNVRGVLLGCRHAIPHMIKAGGGSIINTSSGSGLAGDIQLIAYGTSKGAVNILTKYVAVQYGRQGIRCNAIAPGAILASSLTQFPALAKELARHVVTPRLGDPTDISALAAFLASDESAYITAQIIPCDGGHLSHQPQMANMLDMQTGMS